MKVWIMLGPREYKIFRKVIIKRVIKINNRNDYYAAYTLYKKLPFMFDFDSKNKKLILKGFVSLDNIKIRERKSKRMPYMIKL